MSITASQVKDLREKTGAGMMDAKNALVEAGGDMDKAAELLRQRGIATAEKKSGRVAAEGLVSASISADKKTGVLVEVNCETDFVAKGDQFQSVVTTIGDYIAKSGATDVETLLTKPAPTGSGTVKDYITEQVAQIKENITIRRFTLFQSSDKLVGSYIHTGGKIGVLVEVQGAKSDSAELQAVIKDIAMQIASFSAEFVSRAEIPQSVIDEETRVEMGKEDILSKPENIREKIVSGRVDKLLAQRILLEQAFIKDPGQTVAQYLESQAGGVSVSRFVRYALGEGIEKQESNFAEEVMAAVQAR